MQIADRTTVATASLIVALGDATVGPYELARFDAVVEVDEADGPLNVTGHVAVVQIRPYERELR
jgi:hypothetical protein